MIKYLLTLFLVNSLFLFVQHHSVYAETLVNETEYKEPINVDCTGSTGITENCNALSLMQMDDLSIVWTNSTTEMINMSFNSFDIPSNATIKAFQWKARIKASSLGWSFYPNFSLDSGNTWQGYASCNLINYAPNPYPCRYNTITNFETPTLYMIPHASIFINPTSLNDGTFRFKWYQSTAVKNVEIDHFSLKIIYSVPQATPTPIYTPTPSVSPTPEPFLELPWDYQSQGKSFETAAYHPYSWFDHNYPLQNVLTFIKKALIYTGVESNVNYRSHSGYDYPYGIQLGTPVLAAAPGWAEFKPEAKTGGGGNMIKIDHGNHYQTWYEHLAWYEDKDLKNKELKRHGLIVDKESEKVYVEKGQTIGYVGMTGRTTGPHIHLSVFKDINENNNFNDDGMLGLMDPLGWETKKTDPWVTYGGAQSYKLFLAEPKPVSQGIPTSGGNVNMGNVELEVPANAAPVFFKISSNYGPFETDQDGNESIVPSVFVKAFDNLNNSITQFLQQIKISFIYTEANLQNINEDTLKIKFYNEQTKQWEALPTVLDKNNKIASAYTTHFTQFALMGEVKDQLAPETNIDVQGTLGKYDYYPTSVTVQLNGQDNEGGIGIEYTLFKLDNNDWEEYNGSILIDTEGKHTLLYKSIDNAYNIEEQRMFDFTIDKTAPVSSGVLSGTEGNDGWFRSDVSVSLSAEDNGGVDRIEYSLDGGENYVSYEAPFVVSTEGLSSVLYRAVDLAGNVEVGKTLKLKIDTVTPQSSVYTSGAFGEDGWYRSDVSVAFNATDSESGFEKTFYSLNGEHFEEYVDPFLISDEGTTEIGYYSVDKAGNKESQKSFEVNVDKTAPEAEIQYDLGLFDIKVTGKDTNDSTVVVDTSSRLNPIYTVKDKAGNKLIVRTGELQIGKQITQTIKSLQYNSDSVIALDRNVFFTLVLVDRNSNTVKHLDQYFSMKGDKRLFTDYNSQTNSTKIYTKKFGDTKYTREDKPGIVLLNLYTDKGSVRYTY